MGFGKAKKNLDRKLANVQDMLRQQNHGDRQLAEDRFNQSRDAKNDDEENRRQQELDAQRRQAEEAHEAEGLATRGGRGQPYLHFL